jgi:protoheme IX farnesyltransferase
MPVYARLFRLKLSFLNGVAAVSGYLLFPSVIQSHQICALFAGVALLAAGGSALNQVMEIDLDSRMVRTRQRPLPMKALTPARAACVGSVAILAGTLLLIAFGGLLPPLLGLAALFWYLAVYTPLKRRTSLALLLGALCGAFPPLIGWSLAGGNISDYRIIILAGLLFLWQVPHFWLIQRRHEDDYHQAGIPLFCSRTGRDGQDPFFWIWIAALGAGAMLLPAFGIIERPLALWHAVFPLSLVPIALYCSDRLFFRYLNLFPLLVSIFLLIQKQLIFSN